MPISDSYARVSLELIVVNREARQRKSMDLTGLKQSIQIHGVLNPIIIERDTMVLIAGERRLTASKELSLRDIPVRYADELDPIESQIIELEENLKRSDLHWRDTVRAIGGIHDLYVGKDPSWTRQATAQNLGLDPSTISVYLKVYGELDSVKLSTAPTLMAAYNLLSKADARKIDTAFANIMEAGSIVFSNFDPGLPLGLGDPSSQISTNPQAQGSPLEGLVQGLELLPEQVNPGNPTTVPGGSLGGVSSAQASSQGQTQVPPPKLPESILNASFLDWAPAYKGPKFNFLHCDFPYGIEAFAGSQGAAGTASTADMGEPGLAGRQSTLYDDSPDTYWDLCKCLSENLDNLMQHSGHMMFWFSMKHYHTTLEFFRQNAPSLAFNPMPLIWVKSDNRGILPDAKRGPRQVYETCLIASREDRFIVRAKSNAYSAPTDKVYHHSTKPEPVLRYFMEMFVDETTTLLDPTCGSGSALRAAESLGATRVLGLEIDPEHCANAQAALRRFRAMRSL